MAGGRLALVALPAVGTHAMRPTLSPRAEAGKWHRMTPVAATTWAIAAVAVGADAGGADL